jgi:uncharacterized protein (TIGR02117 family)
LTGAASMRGAYRHARLLVRLLTAAAVSLGVVTCRTPGGPAAQTTEPSVVRSIPVYVVRRGWHMDVGFAADDLSARLSSFRRPFPHARYVLFGFGDRRYLLHGGAADLLLALWPGAGVLLITALTSATPQESFDPGAVRTLYLTPEQNARLQDFVRASFSGVDGDPAPLAPGPYAASAYYAASYSYSAARTCNTWVASALQSSGLPVESSGVVFAWQLWSQLSRVPESEAASQ